eukprot:7379865-Prymnesium_polylepis.1
MDASRQVQLDERLRHRKETKARRKEARAAARTVELEARATAPPASEVEQRKRWEATAARQRLAAERERVKALMRVPWTEENAGVRVIVDLGMERLMVDRELASLATQVTNSYAEVVKRCATRPSWVPLRLALSAIDSSGATMERVRSSAGNLERWPVACLGGEFTTALPLLCAPGAPDLVVLSPDADEPLSTLSTSCVYIVGGLCDYKRIANATRDRAAAHRCRCARLPLREALGAKLGVEILTVDQVVIALVEAANNGGDWAAALVEAVPPR